MARYADKHRAANCFSKMSVAAPSSSPAIGPSGREVLGGHGVLLRLLGDG
jgi:hypothetical protein